jgi:hypothetical protein
VCRPLLFSFLLIFSKRFEPRINVELVVVSGAGDTSEDGCDGVPGVCGDVAP